MLITAKVLCCANWSGLAFRYKRDIAHQVALTGGNSPTTGTCAWSQLLHACRTTVSTHLHFSCRLLACSVQACTDPSSSPVLEEPNARSVKRSKGKGKRPGREGAGLLFMTVTGGERLGYRWYRLNQWFPRLSLTLTNYDLRNFHIPGATKG